VWTSSNPRIRNLYAAIQRQTARRTRPIGLTRFLLSWSYGDTTVQKEARALVCDLHDNGLIIYVSDRLLQNTILNLNLNYPSSLAIQVNILWCEYQSSSPHVQNTLSYPYRLGLQILFKNSEEKTKWASIVEKAKKEYVYREKILPALDVGNESPTVAVSAAESTPEAAPEAPKANAA